MHFTPEQTAFVQTLLAQAGWLGLVILLNLILDVAVALKQYAFRWEKLPDPLVKRICRARQLGKFMQPISYSHLPHPPPYRLSVQSRNLRQAGNPTMPHLLSLERRK